MEELNFSIKERINLNSYSDSKGWRGYCERNKPFTIARANKIVNYFSQFFSRFAPNVTIVYNCFKIKEHEQGNNIIANYVKYIEKYLIDFGYIKVASNSVYDNPDCLSTNFEIKQTTDYDIVSMFALLTMIDDGIDGHCFFVFNELGLIAYPHDDTGFGFIRFKRAENCYENIFLQNVSLISGFESQLVY